MKLPQSLNLSGSIVPFSKAASESVVKKILCNFPKQPSWLGDIDINWAETLKPLPERKALKSKVVKLNIKSNWNSSKNFFEEKKRIEAEICSLFSFLENTDVFAKINLNDKLNLKIISGEITSIDQLQSFFAKAKELSDCIRLYLLKNEYTANFMQEISMDVFENGFNAQNNEDKRKLS